MLPCRPIRQRAAPQYICASFASSSEGEAPTTFGYVTNAVVPREQAARDNPNDATTVETFDDPATISRMRVKKGLALIKMSGDNVDLEKEKQVQRS